MPVSEPESLRYDSATALVTSNNRRGGGGVVGGSDCSGGGMPESGQRTLQPGQSAHCLCSVFLHIDGTNVLIPINNLLYI